ncbi:MAG: hypothetical protein AAFX51_12265, partial [Cyanobacteria bacterium J06636_28]
MNSIRHPQAYYWSILASSVALSAVASNGLAYASQEVSEPVIPDVATESLAHEILPDRAAALFPNGRSLGASTPDTALPQFSSHKVSPILVERMLTDGDLANEPLAPELGSVISPVTPQFSVAPSSDLGTPETADTSTIEASATDDTATLGQDFETPPNLSQVVSSDQVQILNPMAGTVVDVPAITVIIRFPTGADVGLYVNEDIVNDDLIGRTETDPGTNLVTQTWYGVPLSEGTNTLTVVSSDS